jgi:NAD(P)-dependent dehydrogenase (short-subunit alcohol dehydrogenase family)
MASRGAKVVFTYTSDRSREPSNELISRIESGANSSAISVQCDLLNPDTPEKVVKAALETCGPHIDILVNNAAMITDKYISDISTEHFDEVFHLNVRAPMLMVQAVLPHLRRPGGDIFLIILSLSETLTDYMTFARAHYQHWLRRRAWWLSIYWMLRSLESSSRRVYASLGIGTGRRWDYGKLRESRACGQRNARSG